MVYRCIGETPELRGLVLQSDMDPDFPCQHTDSPTKEI